MVALFPIGLDSSCLCEAFFIGQILAVSLESIQIIVGGHTISSLQFSCNLWKSLRGVNGWQPLHSLLRFVTYNPTLVCCFIKCPIVFKC